LVGLDMNNQQMKCPRFEYCLDPLLLPLSAETEEASVDCFLVGNLCMEQDFILKRRLKLPRRPRGGDILAFPNTAGYFMHLFDTPGHSGRLARTLEYPLLCSGNGLIETR
jgi:diaminopimelate decarboxylase